MTFLEHNISYNLVNKMYVMFVHYIRENYIFSHTLVFKLFTKSVMRSTRGTSRAERVRRDPKSVWGRPFGIAPLK